MIGVNMKFHRKPKRPLNRKTRSGSHFAGTGGDEKGVHNILTRGS